jgi:hypothetical protein
MLRYVRRGDQDNAKNRIRHFCFSFEDSPSLLILLIYFRVHPIGQPQPSSLKLFVSLWIYTFTPLPSKYFMHILYPGILFIIISLPTMACLCLLLICRADGFGFGDWAMPYYCKVHTSKYHSSFLIQYLQIRYHKIEICLGPCPPTRIS